MDKLKAGFKQREQLYFYLLILFIGTYPISYIPNSPIIIAICAFFFIDTKQNIIKKLKRSKGNWMISLLILYVIMQVIGMLYTDNTKHGWNNVSRALPMLFLPVVIISEYISKKNVHRLFNFIKFGMVALFFYLCIYQWLIENRTLSSIVNFAYEKQFGIGQIYPALLLVLAIMITFHQLYKRQDININTIVFPILLGFLMLFSSRLSILALAFSMAVFIHQNFKHISRSKKAIVLLIGVVLGTAILYSSPGLRKKADILIKTTDFDLDIIKTKNSITYAKNTIEQRILINVAALHIIKNNPVMGVGTGDYLDALLKEYDRLNFIAGKKQRLNAHNQYLEDYLKTGIIGFGILVMMLIVMFKKSYKNQSFMFYCVCWVAFICFFESFISRHHGAAFVALFIPLFYYIEEKYSNLLLK